MTSIRLHRFLTISFVSALLNINAIASPSATMSEFEAYKIQQQKQQNTRDQFEDYKKQLQAAFSLYQKKTAAIWGQKNVLPNRTNWVSYLNSINQRSVVDFEHGRVNVAIALPIDTALSDKDIKNKLKDNLRVLFEQSADRRSLPDMAKQPALKPYNQPDNQTNTPPVLLQQIADEQGNEVKPEDYDDLSEKIANNATRKTTVGDDGQRRLIYQTQFNLVPNHIKIRAKKYQHQVNLNASEQQLTPELIFAVIETESMFNPTARSPAPAFGLMQLVPTSGARDAYQYLYKQDKIVSDTYLYNPNNNIKLGAAYLHRLYYDYLKGIRSDKSRLWTAIAAYNTGPGNVFRTFAGRYNRSRFGNRENWKRVALREINARSPQQVFQFMQRALPYAETRRYIQKVRSKMGKYVASR